MIAIDRERDALLTQYGREIVKDRYLRPGETSPQEMYARVAEGIADKGDQGHAERLYKYMSLHWFSPATPVLSNIGRPGAGPISCFVGEYEDSMERIADSWHEKALLAAAGGGTAYYAGHLRSLGTKIKNGGVSSGVIPFIYVQNAISLAVSQGGQRSGSSAVYLDVGHPEIEEFIEVRNPMSRADSNRVSKNIHNAVVIPDAFMEAVKKGSRWDLIDPSSGEVKATKDARALWAKILETRMATGEPYLLFVDTINRALPEHHKKLNLKVKTSNLCCEIHLPTGKDHHDVSRTAVCCLSSLNVGKFDEWRDEEMFIPDVMRALDNILQIFIDTYKGSPAYKQAVYSASRERSVGLGVMGFHALCQKKRVPFDSVLGKVWNRKVFSHISEEAARADRILAEERGSCPDAIEAGGPPRRFSYRMAVAPTASISYICGGTSPGIEPWNANAFMSKTLTGNVLVCNAELKKVLIEYGLDTEKVWKDIEKDGGSVRSLKGRLPDSLIEVFRTAHEIDQKWIVQLAADRAPFIDQGQSVNLFLLPEIDKKELHDLHFSAWEKGVKGLYYVRSRSYRSAGYGDVPQPNRVLGEDTSKNNNECLACQ